MSQIKLFNKWDYNNVKVEDISLSHHIAVSEKFSVYVPHTSGKYSIKKFKKSNCPIVERIVCALMMHGRNSGKKLKAIRILKDSLSFLGSILLKTFFSRSSQETKPSEFL